MYLSFITLTLRYDPSNPDDLTVDALAARRERLLKSWSSLWRQYLKPRSGAAVRAIEVAPRGMVHLHILYYGLRPDVVEIRARWQFASGSTVVDVRPVKKAKEAIVELAKYITKGASPARMDVLAGKPGDFIHPALAVRVEIAFSGARLIQCYGQWRKIDVEQDDPDEDDIGEDKRLADAVCPRCQTSGNWEFVEMTLTDWLRLDPFPNGRAVRIRIGPRGPDPSPMKPDRTEQSLPSVTAEPHQKMVATERALVLRPKPTAPSDRRPS